MKPSFRNLFMKKLTREWVVPIISARVSWLICATMDRPAYEYSLQKMPRKP